VLGFVLVQYTAYYLWNLHYRNSRVLEILYFESEHSGRVGLGEKIFDSGDGRSGFICFFLDSGENSM
jgi:hypothetical protein